MLPFTWIIHVCCKHSASICVKRVLLISISQSLSLSHTRRRAYSHYLKCSIYFWTPLSQLSFLAQWKLVWKWFRSALWKCKWVSPLVVLQFSSKIINGFIITKETGTQSSTICMKTICCVWVWTEEKHCRLNAPKTTLQLGINTLTH